MLIALVSHENREKNEKWGYSYYNGSESKTKQQGINITDVKELAV